MSKKLNTREIMISALLISLGIIIPMFSPVKIILEPASFTLGSHIAIFIAMFISKTSATLVALGTTLGFFIGGFPLTVVVRALSHVVFARIGASYIEKNKEKMESFKTQTIFSLVTGIIHGLCEVIVIIPFYISTSLSAQYYDQGFLQSVLLLVGVGTIAHSMVDFLFSTYIIKFLPKAAFVGENAVKTQNH